MGVTEKKVVGKIFDNDAALIHAWPYKGIKDIYVN